MNRTLKLLCSWNVFYNYCLLICLISLRMMVYFQLEQYNAYSTSDVDVNTVIITEEDNLAAYHRLALE